MTVCGICRVSFANLLLLPPPPPPLLLQQLPESNLSFTAIERDDYSEDGSFRIIHRRGVSTVRPCNFPHALRKINHEQLAGAEFENDVWRVQGTLRDSGWSRDI